MSIKAHFIGAFCILAIAPALWLRFKWLVAHGDCGFCGYLGFSYGMALSLLFGGIWLCYALARKTVKKRQEDSERDSS